MLQTLKTIWKYIFHRDRIKDPKQINLKTIRFFVQGHIRTFAKNFGIVDKHILEQASWREMQVLEKNPTCIELGKCEYCECGIQETLISDPACKHGCFPEMLGPMAWEQKKEQENIDFDDTDSKNS